jgi:hypothetical protein
MLKNLFLYSLLATVCFAQSLPIKRYVPSTTTQPTTQAINSLQKELDEKGILRLPWGITKFNQKLVVRSEQSIIGEGFGSTLQWEGSEPYGIEFGDTGPSFFYRAALKSFTLTNSGIKINKLSERCIFENIWIDNAKEDGILMLNPVGERLVFNTCWINQSKRNGITLSTIGGVNGIHFLNCNVQNNGCSGIVIEANAQNAQIQDTKIENCTIQGNKQLDQGAAIVVRGYVTRMTVEDGWIEDVYGTGILVESKTFKDVRRPLDFRIQGMLMISLAKDPVIFKDCYRPRIESLIVSPYVATVKWKGDYAQPLGAMLGLSVFQIEEMTEETLPTIQK